MADCMVIINNYPTWEGDCPFYNNMDGCTLASREWYDNGESECACYGDDNAFDFTKCPYCIYH